LKKAKDQMEIQFNQHFIPPSNPNYIHDKRVDFSTTQRSDGGDGGEEEEDCGWDSSSFEEEEEEEN